MSKVYFELNEQSIPKKSSEQDTTLAIVKYHANEFGSMKFAIKIIKVNFIEPEFY